jgi:hypothetical protein
VLAMLRQANEAPLLRERGFEAVEQEQRTSSRT